MHKYLVILFLTEKEIKIQKNPWFSRIQMFWIPAQSASCYSILYDIVQYI